MDDALAQKRKKRRAPLKKVLILVVMDDALAHSGGAKREINKLS